MYEVEEQLSMLSDGVVESFKDEQANVALKHALLLQNLLVAAEGQGVELPVETAKVEDSGALAAMQEYEDASLKEATLVSSGPTLAPQVSEPRSSCASSRFSPHHRSHQTAARQCPLFPRRLHG